MEILDYHKLKIFKTVADLKSISKAAQMLFMSQPTITLQIKKIENYLGLTLFNRKKNNLELTRQGERLYEYAERILKEYTALEEEIKRLNIAYKDVLMLASSSTIGDFLLPKILPSFLEKNNNVRLNLFTGNSKEVEEGILSKVFNLGLIEDSINSNKLDKKEFYEDEIILIASAKNPIPRTIELEDINRYPLIMREVGSGTRNVVENSLGIKLNPVMEISSSRAIVKLVENSGYISFVSKLIASEMSDCSLIKEVRIEGITIKRYFSIITQKNVRLSTIERMFYNFIAKIQKTSNL